MFRVIRNYNKLKFKKADRNHKKQNPGKKQITFTN